MLSSLRADKTAGYGINKAVLAQDKRKKPSLSERNIEINGSEDGRQLSQEGRISVNIKITH